MATKKYTSLNGLETFLNKLKELFATNKDVSDVADNINEYILEIDYEAHLEFDTSEIVE